MLRTNQGLYSTLSQISDSVVIEMCQLKQEHQKLVRLAVMEIQENELMKKIVLLVAQSDSAPTRSQPVPDNGWELTNNAG